MDDELLSGVFDIWQNTSPVYLFVDDRQVHERSSLTEIKSRAQSLEREIGYRASEDLRAAMTARRTSPERIAEQARRLLATDRIGGVAGWLADVRSRAGTPSQRLVDEALAETFMLTAENRNCLCLSNAERCLFPVRAGGVHDDPEPARAARDIYRSLADRYPGNARYRWLAQLSNSLVEGDQMLPAQPGVPVFSNRSREAGLVNADHPRSAGGTVVDDFNGDGWLDMFLGAYLQTDELLYYENRGDGTFVDRSEAAGIGGQYGSFRLNQADYENDGDLDLFIVRGGWMVPGQNSLLQNDGTGRFTDVTSLAGLAGAHQSMAASWSDYDGDGNVDLFIANLGIRDTCQLYRNRGDGTFVEMTREARLPRLRMASGATWGDVDNDGDADLYVSIAVGPNLLFRIEGDGTFSDITFQSGVSRPLISFPTWFFDYDNDGHLDLFGGTYCMVPEREFAVLTGQIREDPATMLRLHRNTGGGRFADVSRATGLNTTVSAMGGNFGDVDADGDLDFYLGTGSPDLTHIVPNRFFMNHDGERFEDHTAASRLGHLQKGHGIAFADLDHDGDQDIVTNLGGAVPADRFQPALFTNPGNGNRWLEVRLEGTASNRSAIGARVEAVIDDHRSVHRHVLSGGPFGSSPLRQFIGLGDAEEVRELIVRWPSGRAESWFTVSAGQRLTLVEGSGVPR